MKATDVHLQADEVTSTDVIVVGLGIAVYHYVIQAVPGLESGSCAVGVPCSSRYIELFEFASIPFMAGAAFLFVIAALALVGVQTYDSEHS